MADYDPISDTTPNKRRKTQHEGRAARAWDEHEDSNEEFTLDDFGTEPTMPLPASQKRKQLSYPPDAFHADLASLNRKAPSQQPQRNFHVTQPTQPLGSSGTLKHVTQPTQPLPTSPARSNVLVDRSSPTLPGPSSPVKAPQAPAQQATFRRPGVRSSLLASSLAPAGTGFRPPAGVQQRPAPIVVHDSDDEDADPPVSSDEETQGLKSNIKPTTFKKGGRGLDSTPNRERSSDTVVADTPRGPSNAAPGSSASIFSQLMGDFRHDESAQPLSRRPTNDLASAYASTSRAARPQQRQAGPARAQQVDAVRYKTLEDVHDFALRKKIESMRRILPNESVQRCVDALARKRGNEQDAMDWLAETEERVVIPDSDDVDELSSMSPVVRKGVAVAKPSQASRLSSQPFRPMAKQEVKAPSRTIAEKYATAQPVHKPSQAITQQDDDDDEDEDDAPKPRRRLVMGRKVARSPSPPSSPPPQLKQRPQGSRKAIVIDDDDDDDDDSGLGREALESEDLVEPEFDTRLLKFFNECSSRDLAELSALPEETVSFVLSQRPFASLDAIRTISNASETKSGKKSKSRPVGDKMVEVCTEMWAGYDAVDELVSECEKIAKPIQQTLKGWGIENKGDGELQLMNLDEAHDSGIGTPASSCAADDIPATGSRQKKKGRFLAQPDNMSGDIELKDYQLVGLNWLKLLWSKKISCILADDMGLGKTCQVISFLAQLQKEEVDGVHLVVVPGSTLENWLREFARFAPSLKVIPYYGAQAERPALQDQINDEFDTIDVVVTTYDMAAKPDDNKFLRKLEPAVCVYDEAHILRNPNSQRYEALMRIKADFKILLTGTPIQNNLQELVSILAFIMPDLFKANRDQLDFIFKHKATTKDADHAALLSAERIARARTIMTPFILRRKKAQVLDLPAKHNRVEMCDMTPSQEAYYHSVVSEAQQVFADKAAGNAGSKAAAKKASSNILMTLRQAAIHPLLARRLYTDKRIDRIVAELRKDEFAGESTEKVRAYITGESKTGQNLQGGDFALHRFCYERESLRRFALKKNEWMDCGKVQKFKELVAAYAANGDRVLVFSQFTTLMDILEAVLETMSMKFFRLDGSTAMAERQDMIDAFYDDTSIPVFMLSTKAGGAGINLACANKVIIFDSGFNPQDDIQAENRAHRVGQTREVEVVRLVTRGTIEEQIHALGESKLALDEMVAGEGASAADGARAEKQGEELVKDMLLNCLHTKEEKEGAQHGDVKDAFKAGMEGAGVKIASKQAQF